MPHYLAVSPDEVRAARVHVKAYRTAGLEPDPYLVRVAEAKPRSSSRLRELSERSSVDATRLSAEIAELFKAKDRDSHREGFKKLLRLAKASRQVHDRDMLLAVAAIGLQTLGDDSLEMVQRGSKSWGTAIKPVGDVDVVVSLSDAASSFVRHAERLKELLSRNVEPLHLTEAEKLTAELEADLEEINQLAAQA
ncbi:hypothetical protein [Blastococcus litoris]|uniref:hypothetical protein n=1 Tax=Blastococcus litoris TaxID=2171622 RepID=UPI000E30146F|nr:hypothetical protein [Blastococcus litoris]